MAVALAGCDRDGSVTERLELAGAVAETARVTELGRLQELAASEDERGDESDQLSAIMNDLETPAGVAEVRIPLDRASASRIDQPEGGLLVQLARPMVIAPDDGEPFCAVVGLGSDGTAAGTPADGDVADDCRDAVIPAQDENATEGNPLGLWDQDPSWLDPRDPRP
jgi:hypothetical protein